MISRIAWTKSTQARFFGFVVFAILLLSSCYMSYLTFRLNQARKDRDVTFVVEKINENIKRQLDFARLAAFSLERTINNQGQIENFDSIASIVLAETEYLDAVQLVPNGVITHCFPLEGNEAVIGYNIMRDKDVSLEAFLTIEKNEMYFAGPFELKQGGMGVVGRLPVYFNGKLWGFSAVVIRLERLIENAGISKSTSSSFNFQFAKVDPVTGIETFFLSTPGSEHHKYNEAASRLIWFPEADWRIYLIPQSVWIQYPGAIMILMIGIPLSILAGLLLTQLLQYSGRIKQVHSELQAQHDEMNEGIRSAKYLQQSVLQTESELLTVFPDSFVILKPRNIVSGDFFWCFKAEDHHFLAVVDCTGHGISGALLSMIGVQMLQQIVVLQGERSPAQILNKLNELITNLLSKDQQKSSLNGMDMILIRHDIRSSKICYAGAQRPLYTCNSGHLEELPGNRMGIGGHHSASVVKQFAEHTIDVTKNCMLYLTTDGFHSQFGGKKGRKLGRKNLRSWLSTISRLPLKDQRKKLLTDFNAWKGEEDQVDDVLLVGIQL